MATTTNRLLPDTSFDDVADKTSRHTKLISKLKFRHMIGLSPIFSNEIDISLGKFGIGMILTPSTIKRAVARTAQFNPVRYFSKVVLAYVSVLSRAITAFCATAFTWVCSIKPSMEIAVGYGWSPVGVFIANPTAGTFHPLIGSSPVSRYKASRLTLDVASHFISARRYWRRLVAPTFTKFHISIVPLEVTHG